MEIACCRDALLAREGVGLEEGHQHHHQLLELSLALGKGGAVGQADAIQARCRS